MIFSIKRKPNGIKEYTKSWKDKNFHLYLFSAIIKATTKSINKTP